VSRNDHAAGAEEGFAQRDLNEQGAALFELAVSLSVFLSVWTGTFFMILALYSYLFVSDAAREGSRYAMVRGSQCSTNTPLVTNCGVTQAELQTWVETLGYPGLNKNNLTVTVNWLTATSSGSPPTTSWAACSGSGCNAPGNLVQVVVTYAFPLSIPFWRRSTLNLSSTSDMVISQ
jgi:Flp pilus assembly protein TadG